MPFLVYVLIWNLAFILIGFGILTWRGSLPHSLSCKTPCGPACTVPVKSQHQILTSLVLKKRNAVVSFVPFLETASAYYDSIFFSFIVGASFRERMINNLSKSDVKMKCVIAEICLAFLDTGLYKLYII